MEILTDPSAFPKPGFERPGRAENSSGSVVTIGAFDGVHLGHQAVFRELRRLGRQRGLPSVVLTFDRHPATVVRPDSAPRVLTDLDQKLELLAATGDVDYTVVLRFDEARAAEEAHEFVDEIIVGALAARLVVVGDDFHFGRGRRGTVALLREMGVDRGFDTVALELLDAGAGYTAPVSSTRIRELVAAGEVTAASALLGRPHEVRGVVEAGDQRGQDLGFPTANVAVPKQVLLPGEGIYAGWYLRPDGVERAAAISLGHRPTFTPTAQTPVLEAFLLDFDGSLYGEPARVRFVSRLRDEERFDSVDALVAQTARDVEAARTLLLDRRSGVGG